MKIYLVGGAVRDELLQRPGKDRDYVVVGSTPAEMLSLGFEQIGADFPVFLHPKTREEYALARTERKTGKGYNGFATEFDPTITLEEDLRRRDLTINAMAKDMLTGEIIDPFNGLYDLQDRTLRHVSPAFAEDPLRVLRVARFRARYDFKVAHETTELMKKLVSSGELDHLTPERVWLELEKGLTEKNPTSFITTLMVVDAWGRLFPDIKIGGTLYRLKNAIEMDFNSKLMIVFSETGYRETDATLIKYKASAETMKLLHVFKVLQTTHKAEPLSVQQVINTLKAVEAFRRPELLMAVLPVAKIINDEFGRLVQSLVDSYEIIKHICFASLSEEQQKVLKGKEIGEAIDIERLKKLM